MFAALCALLFVLGGCNSVDMLQKFASPAEQALAKSYIDALRQRHFADIVKAADPSMADAALDGQLSAWAGYVPAGEPKSVTLVGAHRLTADDATTVNMTFEYEFPGRWLLFNIALKSQAGKTTIVGFNALPQLKSLEEQNKFTLDGKTPAQYAFLALAVLLPLITLYALVLCIRTPLKGPKWPWLLFVVCGFGNFSLSWATGQWVFAPVAFQLFSASAFATPYGPWTLAVSLPLGAIVFLVLRKRLRAGVGGN
jgi:hypothetical protein